ncbi:hypothetical protein D917_07063 [Trichinella nativa]|uniref:Uncharacterized protein n=1 Tax=Trichinella nativa TaxID=6335 RepID=A0A1Y3EQ33_9BILA|nr:hypothetical protein D917_07063 [Trichinella nativa]
MPISWLAEHEKSNCREGAVQRKRNIISASILELRRHCERPVREAAANNSCSQLSRGCRFCLNVEIKYKRRSLAFSLLARSKAALLIQIEKLPSALATLSVGKCCDAFPVSFICSLLSLLLTDHVVG